METRKIDISEMNTKQQDALDCACRQMLIDNACTNFQSSFGKDPLGEAMKVSEIKTLELEKFDDRDWVLAYIVVGGKKDEKTIASIYCRNQRHLRIGKNGGLTLLNGKQKNVKGFKALTAITN